jgi:hypothetical protein
MAVPSFQIVTRLLFSIEALASATGDRAAELEGGRSPRETGRQVDVSLVR